MPSNQLFSNISNRCNGDRFIPNRSCNDINMAHFKLIAKEQNNQNQSKNIFKQKPNQFSSYIKLLQNTVNYKETPILSFTKSCISNSKIEICGNNSLPWPVYPRKNPVLNKPDIVLDLPNVSTEIASNILDWSSTGNMATVWFNKVYIWSNKLAFEEEVTSTNIAAYRALKWSHDGSLLAVASKYSLALWDMIKKKPVMSNCVCFCAFPLCHITALAWDKTDKFIVSGCCNGIIRIWNLSAKIKHLCDNTLFAHYDSIINLAFSSKNKYLCSSGSDYLVRIWLWPTLEPHLEIYHHGPVRAIAFHPWKDAILAIGGGLGDGSLAIWNLNSFNRIDFLQPEQDSFVDCLTWNSVTGELVSSHQVENEKTGEAETKILVLASLNRVVDVIDRHIGRVLYLLWDSTGSKLATAGSEECLYIWNFFGKNLNNINDHSRKKNTEQSKCLLTNFGKCIR